MSVSENFFSKWFSYFSELYKKRESKYGYFEKEEGDVLNTALNEPFTLEELKENLKKLKNNKAPGLDGIQNEMIKCSSKEILDLILAFFNLSLRLGLSSVPWCQGILSPIHKDGHKADPENYRGICLMNCLMKLYCMLINERIFNALEKMTS